MIGYVLSYLVVVALLADAASIWFSKARTHEQLAETGFADKAAPTIGAIAFVSAVLYAVPQTGVLGAILITGFLGGAICAHFRLGKIASAPQIVSFVLGVTTWGGLYLRSAPLRDLFWSG